MISVRQHWMALLRPGALFLIIIGLALAWIGFNPKLVLSLLHITKESPEAVLAFLRTFYNNKIPFILAPFGIAAFMILMAWTWWSISYFEVDATYLKYKMGPFIENRIPLRAIQDIRKNTSFLGWIFGYGTLVVDAGREEEALLYVPDVNSFIEALQPGSFR